MWSWLFILFVAAVVLLASSSSSSAEARASSSEESFLAFCRDVPRSELESCLIRIINDDLRDLYEIGSEKYQLPALGQLPVGDVIIDEGDATNAKLLHNTPSSYIKGIFRNVFARGLAEFSLSDLSIDYDNSTATASAVIPELRLNGDYILDARFILAPIKGNGTFWFKLEDVLVTGTAKLAVVDIPEQRMQFHNTSLDFTFSDIGGRLNGLFGDNSALSGVAESVLKRNSKEIVEEIKPLFRSKIVEIFEGVTNGVLKTLPLNELAGSQYIQHE